MLYRNAGSKVDDAWCKKSRGRHYERASGSESESESERASARVRERERSRGKTSSPDTAVSASTSSSRQVVSTYFRSCPDGGQTPTWNALTETARRSRQVRRSAANAQGVLGVRKLRAAFNNHGVRDSWIDNLQTRQY